MEIKIPSAVLEILEDINNAGYEAYIVGGCVRDFLLGKEPNDWDITTGATPETVKKIFRRTIDTGIAHGTVTVMKDKEGYEVTTYRIDGEYEDSRHPKEVIFTPSLEEDLKRRDFTINAMAYHPKKGLVDIFSGEKDLKEGIIRAVGNPIERFNEDALRMMRAIRFAATLGYTIEDETFQAIKQLAPTICRISAERVQAEIVKLLISDNPYRFRLFYESGLSSFFMPEFDENMNTPQNHPHHVYNVGEHILHSLEYVENDRILRLAMLFHDIGKCRTLTTDEDGITHFYGHPGVGENMTRSIMKRLKFDNEAIDTVSILTGSHDITINADSRAVRRALNKFGPDNFERLLKVKYADCKAQSDYKREEKLSELSNIKEIYDNIMAEESCFNLSMLAVTGRDLIKMGCEPGPLLGKLLNEMLEDVMDNPEHNNREYLLNEFVCKKSGQ